jgi:subtilisin family serine protease
MRPSPTKPFSIQACAVKPACIATWLLSCCLASSVMAAAELEHLPASSQSKLGQSARIALQNQRMDGFLLLLDEGAFHDSDMLPPDRAGRTQRRVAHRQYLARQRARIEAEHGAEGLRIEGRYRNLAVLKVGFDRLDAVPRLLHDDAVLALVEDERLHPSLSQSLPLIDQPSASEFGWRGNNQSVAVLDTGLDYTLNSFGNCSAPGIPAGCRVLHVQDFAPEDGQLDAGATQHGTYVSAIVANTAPETALIGLDVFDGSSALSSDILEAIDWIIDQRDTWQIGTANFSLGGSTRYTSPCNQASNPFRNAFAELVANDILPIVAAGNQGWSNGLSSPACLSNALSVGATYDQTRTWIDWGICRDEPATTNQVACFSNSASFLNLLAPGAVIATEQFSGGGTSMAAPHVSAASAILRSRFPDQTQSQIRTRLSDGGTQITDPRNGLSLPLLDLSGALAQAHDAFASARILAPNTLLLSDHTGFSSIEAGEPGGLSHSLWYSLSFSAAGWYRIELTSSDPTMVLNLYRGDDLDQLVPLAGIDTQSASTVFLDATANYWLQVGSPASGGSFDLVLTPDTEPRPIPVDEDIPFLPWWALLLSGGLLGVLMRRGTDLRH